MPCDGSTTTLTRIKWLLQLNVELFLSTHTVFHVSLETLIISTLLGDSGLINNVKIHV